MKNAMNSILIGRCLVPPPLPAAGPSCSFKVRMATALQVRMATAPGCYPSSKVPKRDALLEIGVWAMAATGNWNVLLRWCSESGACAP